MKSRLALLVCAAVPLASIPVAAQSPNPNEPYVQSVSYGGSGCPGGTVSNSFANDRLSFTLIFDTFIASSGTGVPATEARKNCQLNINVRVPQGSGQFCAAFDYRGYVGLPQGVQAEQKSVYYFDGEEEEEGETGETSQFAGPVNKDYLARDPRTVAYDQPDGPRVIPININSQVRLTGDLSRSSQITTDSIDGKITMGPCAGPDTTAPAIAIATPVLYGMYGVGATVTPQFTCTDETGGSGVASCTGAATLDTSSVGPKTFTVTATDNAGNTSTSSVTYAVGGKEECKGGGHNQFLVPTFTNQGQCVSTYAGKK
jgi:hypothetical protein